MIQYELSKNMVLEPRLILHASAVSLLYIYHVKSSKSFNHTTRYTKVVTLSFPC